MIRHAFTGILVLFPLLVTAGCIGGDSSAGGFENPASGDSSAPGTAFGFPDYPQPPAEIAVSAQINDKEQIEKTITVFFSGGNGEKMVKRAWVLFKPDSGEITRVPLETRKQSEVVLTGTAGEDQVRVYAEYFDGKTYLIGERSLRLRQRL